MLKHLFVIISLCVLASCSSLTKTFDTTTDTSSDMSLDESQTTPMSQDVNTYFDFDDILIPSDLQLDQEQSIIFETRTLKAGTLHFHGRVEPVSLFNFYTHHLPQDNWSISSQMKYGHFLIIAEKKDKFCVLTIRESGLKTHLQVWVTPRIP